MKRLFTFVVLCLTLGVFIIPVKAEEKINTNEWITVSGEEKKTVI